MIYNRADIVNFMKPSEESTTHSRMTGFTEGGKSLNSSTYDRRYIDEKTERSDVTSYSVEIAYAFDRMTDNAVHDKIVEVHEKELVGENADIVTVNFNEKGTGDNVFKAKRRIYAIAPNSEGDSTDAYTYSGAFKANGEVEEGTATSTDGWKTCTFTANTPSNS